MRIGGGQLFRGVMDLYISFTLDSCVVFLSQKSCTCTTLSLRLSLLRLANVTCRSVLEAQTGTMVSQCSVFSHNSFNVVADQCRLGVAAATTVGRAHPVKSQSHVRVQEGRD